MDIERIRPLQDNVLVCFHIHEDPHEERLSPGGIVLPATTREVYNEDAFLATVVAAGPGYYPDKFLGHELGTAPVGVTRFIPMDPAIVPGARVILDKIALAANRIYGDDRVEYRMVRAQAIAAVIEE